MGRADHRARGGGPGAVTGRRTRIARTGGRRRRGVDGVSGSGVGTGGTGALGGLSGLALPPRQGFVHYCFTFAWSTSRESVYSVSVTGPVSTFQPNPRRSEYERKTVTAGEASSASRSCSGSPTTSTV